MQFQTLGSHLEEPKGLGDKKEIQQFRTKVTADKRELKAVLQQRLQQAEEADARRENEMSALIKDALTQPNKVTQREPATFTNTKIAENAIFEAAVTLDDACRSMLSEYRAFEAMIEQMAGENKDTVTKKWTQDVEKTERLLRLGHKTAVRNVRKVLGTEAEGAETETETVTEEGGIGVLRELNMELRDGLRYAERGVKRMVKSLRNDED